MRCYNNGAHFLDRVLGPKVDWKSLEQRGRRTRPGCDGVSVMPFIVPEPSLKVGASPSCSGRHVNRRTVGNDFAPPWRRLAFLIARGVEEHEKAGQTIPRITVSGGIARSDLMCEYPGLGLGPVPSIGSNRTKARHRRGRDGPRGRRNAPAPP